MRQELNEKPIVHIVDDDGSLRSALDSLFRSVGLQTRAYGSAIEFLDARRDDLPGCIVLDVRRLGMSGLDFQTQLSALGIHLPVILITATEIFQCRSAR